MHLRFKFYWKYLVRYHYYSNIFICRQTGQSILLDLSTKLHANTFVFSRCVIPKIYNDFNILVLFPLDYYEHEEDLYLNVSWVKHCFMFRFLTFS